MDITWPLSDGRVSIRPFGDGDAAAFLEYWQLPECQEYTSHTVATLEEARAFLSERTARTDVVMGALTIDGQVVGDIGGRRYRPETLGPDPHGWDFYLGYTVRPDRWGQGIASSAVALLTPALHHDGGIRRVVAKAFSRNQASIRVLLKNGFELEGTERAAVLGRDGTWLDDCTLAHLDPRFAVSH
ncbi:GNAT family N-acetyltransferase [Humibacillus sp. DSM 29435]|uniref:GNAT family N-acetyltransferase n=1 Tax=Humibacillus sp. DSM 29435 TaxID=1869167 RepID=UPI001585E66D|nr:GNAT family N-acetyltransferase [Humibacillus sp. DSM 29435]